MRVAIVGAGCAGLAAAHELAKAGIHAVVFERGGEPGGRISTASFDGFTFDTGATSIAPRGLSIERTMLEELPTDDLVRVEKPIFIHSSLRVSAGDPAKNATPRYAYRHGNAQFAALLAKELDVRLNQPIEALKRVGSEFEVGGEVFGAVLLTLPIPLATPILWSINETRPLANARYRSCLSISLGFESGMPATPYHALLEPEQRHPLTFLAIETEKCDGRAPEGGAALVAQMSPEYSRDSFDKPDDALVREAMVFLHRLYPSLPNPIVSNVKRWKYSQPESVSLFDSVNQPGDRLLLAGDGVLAGRTESAYESGVKAARLILERS